MALSLVGGLLGAGVSGASKVASEGRRGLDTALAASIGRINVLQILRYVVYAMILLGILIIVINIARGLFIGFDQFNCSLGDSLDLFNAYNCSAKSMPSYTWWIIEEWYLRMYFLICVQIAILLIMWEWSKFVLDWLLHIDQKIDMIDDWLFGRRRWLTDEIVMED